MMLGIRRSDAATEAFDRPRASRHARAGFFCGRALRLRQIVNADNSIGTLGPNASVFFRRPPGRRRGPPPGTRRRRRQPRSPRGHPPASGALGPPGGIRDGREFCACVCVGLADMMFGIRRSNPSTNAFSQPRASLTGNRLAPAFFVAGHPVYVTPSRRRRRHRYLFHAETFSPKAFKRYQPNHAPGIRLRSDCKPSTAKE
ncbi:hypothetical protein ES705_38385 [subsurface metagenome]